ncbi:MAG: DUF4974 domain-containing protein [Lentimicrobium sp.]|nr:DUF4974 domain-containing protein [Lentimicrobium sp.]
MLQDEATVEEQQETERMIDRSENNRRLYNSYRNLLFLTSSEPVSFDSDKAWSRVKSRIDNATGPLPDLKSRKYTIRKISLTVASMAAIFLLAFGIFSLLKPDPKMIELASGDIVVSSDQLPDGSSYSLNSGSVITYPEKFTGHTREVFISGEAFFEIRHNPEIPFIVHASGMDIRVKGTSFNVTAIPGDEFVIVAVNTGNVVVYPANSSFSENNPLLTHLSSGEKATYNHQTQNIVKGINDDLNLLSWKTGVLVFRESRLADVFKSLEKKYDAEFIVKNSEISAFRLTARIENESLPQVMESIALIFDVKYEIKGNEVTLFR